MIRRLLPFAGAIYVIIAAQPATAQELTVTLTAEQPVYTHALTPGAYQITANSGVECQALTVDPYITVKNPDGNIIAQDDDSNHNQSNCLASKLTVEIPGDGYTLNAFGCCGRPYGTITIRIDPLEPATTTTAATTTTSTTPATTTTEPTTTTTTDPPATTTTLATYPTEPSTTSSTSSTTTTATTAPQSTTSTSSTTSEAPNIVATTNVPTTTAASTSTTAISTTSTTSPTSSTLAKASVKPAASNALAPGVTPEAQRAIVAATLTMLIAAPTQRTKK